MQIGQAAHPMSLSLSEITPKAIQQRKYTGQVRLKASLQISYLPKTVTFTLFFNALGRCFARQSRTAAAVAPASHGLDTIFELFPPNVLPI